MVKFPEKSMAPPTVERAGNSKEDKAELLATWLAPATVERRGKEMLARSALATKAIPPPAPPSDLDPTVVRLGAEMLSKLFP